MKNSWMKLFMLGRKNASKEPSQSTEFSSEIIYEVTQQWNKLDTGKNPWRYDDTGFSFESRHKPELSWKTAPILLFSPVILLPANLWILIIKAQRANGVMEKCSGLLISTSLDQGVFSIVSFLSLVFLTFQSCLLFTALFVIPVILLRILPLFVHHLFLDKDWSQHNPEKHNLLHSTFLFLPILLYTFERVIKFLS